MKDSHKTIIHISTLPVWVMGNKAGMPSTHRMIDYLYHRGISQIYISLTENPFSVSEVSPRLQFINLHIPEILDYKANRIKFRLKRKILVMYTCFKYRHYLRSVINTHKPAAVITHLYAASIIMKILFPLHQNIFAKLYGTVCMFGNLKNHRYRRIKLISIIPFMLSYCGFLFTDDGTQSDRLASLMRIPENKFSFLMNGVEERVPVSSEIIQQIKHKLGIEQNSIIGLFVGRMNNLKGVDQLIYFIEKNRELPIHWIIIGDGVEIDNIRNKNFDNVSLLGRIPHAELSKYYCLADFFVSFNILSNMNNPVYDALEYGLPVFSLKRGHDSIGIEDIIITKQTVDQLTSVFKSTFHIFEKDNAEQYEQWKTQISRWADLHLPSWDERYEKEWEFIRHRTEKCGRK
ncbi:MAG: glycosyltransferase family 4 protein [candidate division WOR-3 bacterium]|nr:glycosyltransferase family 4 protein [candidate division WOR-3 bacterium]